MSKQTSEIKSTVVLFTVVGILVLLQVSIVSAQPRASKNKPKQVVEWVTDTACQDGENPSSIGFYLGDVVTVWTEGAQNVGRLEIYEAVPYIISAIENDKSFVAQLKAKGLVSPKESAQELVERLYENGQEYRGILPARVPKEDVNPVFVLDSVSAQGYQIVSTGKGTGYIVLSNGIMVYPSGTLLEANTAEHQGCCYTQPTDSMAGKIAGIATTEILSQNGCHFLFKDDSGNLRDALSGDDGEWSVKTINGIQASDTFSAIEEIERDWLVKVGRNDLEMWAVIDVDSATVHFLTFNIASEVRCLKRRQCAGWKCYESFTDYLVGEDENGEEIVYSRFLRTYLRLPEGYVLMPENGLGDYDGSYAVREQALPQDGVVEYYNLNESDVIELGRLFEMKGDE